MHSNRDWLSFNNAWRQDDPAGDIGRWIYRAGRVLFWPLRHPHQAVVAAEPWGIMLAVIGLFLSLMTFALDYGDKIEERTVRAWQLVTTKAPGNSGKMAALEYLTRRDGFWCDRHDCVITLKSPSPLAGIDLSPDDGQAGAYLRLVDLSRANLREANLRGAFLIGSNLSGSNLSGAVLVEADLYRADLVEADLSDANLVLANLREADLSRADLKGANLGQADLAFAYLSGADLQGASWLRQAQLDRACGDGGTQLPAHLTIPRCAKVDWFERYHSLRFD